MDRREFLVAGAVGGMAVALGGRAPGARAAVPRARKLKKAVKYGMIEAGSSVEEKFGILRDIGYDGVELDSPSPLKLDEVLKAKEATGLEIPGVVDSVHWTTPLSDRDPAVRDEGRRALETALRDCRAYGGTSVLLVPAVVNKETAYADAYSRSQEEIRRVLPLARELGVRVAIENVWNHFLLSPLEAARYVDELGEGVGWHFDPGNIVNYGWPEQWVRVLGKRILKIDVKEFSRTVRDREGLWKGFNAEIGEGDCDWPAVMHALDEVGYGNGWAAAEVTGGDEERLRRVYERMCRVLDG